MHKKYRIRWAWISVRGWREKRLMCLAEKSVSIFGFHLFYFPFDGASWHHGEEEARKDIEQNIKENSLKPTPTFFDDEGKLTVDS